MGAPNIANSSALALTEGRNSVMVRDPLDGFLSWFLTCLMRPREGLAYVFARIVHASRAVPAQAIKGIMVGEIEPIKALSRSLS